MRFEVLPADLTTNSTRLKIIEGAGDRTTELVGVRNAQAGLADFENSNDLARVLEMRSKEDWTSSMNRLDQIVSPDWNQRPTDECD